MEISIFGRNRNMTIAAKLAKDPSIAGLVQLAGRIYEQWQAADKATALEQRRTAAEAALKRLEGQPAREFSGDSSSLKLLGTMR